MSDPNNVLPLPQEQPDEPAQQPANQAAQVIRAKVAALYTDEPLAKEEIQEIADSGVHSKHQKYMQELSNSGKSLAEIQTAWHTYYQNLPDTEKHEVWQEFYANHARATRQRTAHHTTNQKPEPAQESQQSIKAKATSGSVEQDTQGTRSVSDIKSNILGTVTARGKLQKKHHVQSLIFGLSMGLIVVGIFMFGFFNEKFIAPLITPSREVTSTQIIVDPNANVAVGPEPKIIIPKINLEIPMVYVDTIDEKAIQNGLENGAVHYATSPKPGQNGNVVVVGHSSSNIFNNGKYKFAFVLLNRLQVGDTFMMNYNGKRYTYKIFERKIVKPSDVSVLGPNERTATATLITCDPPGSNVNRLIMVADQISPNVNDNVAADTAPEVPQAATVPGNSVSLFQRLFGWIL